MEANATSIPSFLTVPKTFEAFLQDSKRVNAVLDEVYRRGDRLMCVMIAVHLTLTVIFSAFYDTWFASLIIGGIAGGMFYLSVWLLPRHRVTRIISGISLQTFVALHIWQMHGLAEMHFFFFTAFTAMVVYQDGLSMWPGTILIILQHILFAVLHNSGVQLYFFEDAYVGFVKLFFHFGIAVMQVTLCGVWAHSLRRQALLDAFQRESLKASQAKLEIDMAARLEAERALAAREAEARLAIVANHTSNGVVIADSEGRIEWVNPAFERMVGHTMDELIGKPRGELLVKSGANREVVEELFKSVQTEGEASVELCVQREHKEQWLYIQGKRVLIGEKEQLITVEIDVTARKEAEVELERARAKAEEAARAKGEFLATMSHEMRTPLNGILGMSDLLGRSRLEAKQAEQLETLRTCADNLLALVNDVLDLSKIEAGGLEIEQRPFEPRLAVDDVLAMNAARAQGKGIDLVAVVDRDVPEMLIGDMTRTRQTLTNLVANAVKFTSQGEIEVRVSVVDGKDGTREVLFSVRDTGIGIDAATRKRLFSPFTQADGSISRRFGGSGLGLAISRRLVEAMGGTIDFESEVGQGSRFFFTLPYRPAKGAGTPQVLFGRKACVVSAHRPTREALVEHLASRKLDVKGYTEFSAIDVESFDVAVIDGTPPSAELERLSKRVDLSRVIVIARGSGLPGTWKGPALTWPVRSGPLETALVRVLDPKQADDRLVERGLSWKVPQGTRALIVEDNPVNQVVAQSILEDIGFEVEIAEDGERALEMLSAADYDIVLMDCQMPKLDGFETTRRFRAGEAPGRHLPVLALTAQAMAGDEEECRRAGMDDYLAKPIDRRTLIAKLQKLLGEFSSRRSTKKVLDRELVAGVSSPPASAKAAAPASTAGPASAQAKAGTGASPVSARTGVASNGGPPASKGAPASTARAPVSAKAGPASVGGAPKTGPASAGAPASAKTGPASAKAPPSAARAQAAAKTGPLSSAGAPPPPSAKAAAPPPPSAKASAASGASPTSKASSAGTAPASSATRAPVASSAAAQGPESAPASLEPVSEPSPEDLAEIESFLAAFANDVGPAAVKRLLRAFTGGTPEQLGVLRTAAGLTGMQVDAEKLARIAHSLRGATRSLGLRSLGDLLEKLERESASDPASVRDVAATIDMRLSAVCRAMSARETEEAAN